MAGARSWPCVKWHKLVPFDTCRAGGMSPPMEIPSARRPGHATAAAAAVVTRAQPRHARPRPRHCAPPPEPPRPPVALHPPGTQASPRIHARFLAGRRCCSARRLKCLQRADAHWIIGASQSAWHSRRAHRLGQLAGEQLHLLKTVGQAIASHRSLKSIKLTSAITPTQFDSALGQPVHAEPQALPIRPRRRQHHVNAVRQHWTRGACRGNMRATSNCVPRSRRHADSSQCIIQAAGFAMAARAQRGRQERLPAAAAGAARHETGRSASGGGGGADLVKRGRRLQ